MIDGRLVAESPDAVLESGRQARVPLIIGATSGDNVAMMVEPARFAARYGAALTSSDRAAARSVHDYWVAFARDGDPGDAGGPRWPAYDRDHEMILDFTNAGPAVVDPMCEALDAVEAQRRR